MVGTPKNIQTMWNIKVKICCISSPDEAKLAIQYGAAAIGFVELEAFFTAVQKM